MHSRLALLVLLASLPAVTGTCAHCTFVGPASPAAQPAWLAGLNQERDTVRSTINYTGGVFSNPAMQWTQQSYIQPQSHPYDRFFYDPVKGEYTIDRFLDDLKVRVCVCCAWCVCVRVCGMRGVLSSKDLIPMEYPWSGSSSSSVGRFIRSGPLLPLSRNCLSVCISLCLSLTPSPGTLRWDRRRADVADVHQHRLG